MKVAGVGRTRITIPDWNITSIDKSDANSFASTRGFLYGRAYAWAARLKMMIRLPRNLFSNNRIHRQLLAQSKWSVANACSFTKPIRTSHVWYSRCWIARRTLSAPYDTEAATPTRRNAAPWVVSDIWWDQLREKVNLTAQQRLGSHFRSQECISVLPSWINHKGIWQHQ